MEYGKGIANKTVSITVPLYKSIFQPFLEYRVQFWPLWKVSKAVGKVQRRVTGWAKAWLLYHAGGWGFSNWKGDEMGLLHAESYEIVNSIGWRGIECSLCLQDRNEAPANGARSRIQSKQKEEAGHAAGSKLAKEVLSKGHRNCKELTSSPRVFGGVHATAGSGNPLRWK